MCGCPIPKQRFTAVACDSKLHTIILWHVTSVKLSIGKKITGLELMTLNCKKTSMFPNLWNWCLWESYTVYKDLLESRQAERMFKPVSPKQDDQASVGHDSLSLNLLVCWAEVYKQCVCLFLIQQKSLCNWFSLRFLKQQ